MLGHIGPALLRVPGETQFIHDYIVATRGRSVKSPEGSSPQWEIGGCPRCPTGFPISPIALFTFREDWPTISPSQVDLVVPDALLGGQVCRGYAP